MSKEYEEFLNSESKKVSKKEVPNNSFEKVSYSKLNSKQKENYNFHRLAALLASFGFNCIWLNDDVHGADLLALSTKGDVFKIQLKSRLTFDKKYLDKNLYIAFPYEDGFYVYGHDEALQLFIKRFEQTKSWNDGGGYSTTTKYNSMGKYFINTDSKFISF